MNRDFYASLHTHVRSLFDADINPTALCQKIKEMGGQGCAITDHGVLSSIEDYRPVFKEYGLKMIPGVELYVDGGLLGRLHLVLLAVNDSGYRSICKIVTESNKNLNGGYPVSTKEMLKALVKKGDVIALSACMHGVISKIFLQNAEVNKKIEDIKGKQNKYINPSNPVFVKATTELETAENNLKKALAKRDETKALAEMSFVKREKAVTKLEKSSDPGAETARTELEADKKASEKAKAELAGVKAELEAAKKAVSQKKAAVKKFEESIEKFLDYEAKINELKSEYKTEEEIYQKAKEEMVEYLDIFGKGNFYAEIQNHGIPEEAIAYKGVVRVAKELNVPLVATNDVHILDNSENERLKRQILRSLRFGKSFEAEGTGDSELYLKDNEQLSKALLELFDENTVKEAIKNIEVIFDRCNVVFETGKHYPKYSENADEVLDREVEKGIRWRFPEGMDEAHVKRLEHELPIIKSMGYADYHLVVKDFLEYGRLLGYVPDEKLPEAPLTIEELKEYIKRNKFKNPGLTIGPGRGSAVGSLVCYLLGITNLDPLKYDLLFERFLNPERISMPDIDSDIYSTGRSKVIDYVRNKYGQESVSGIMTLTMQGPKGSINIAAKYYGFKKCGEPFTSLGKQISSDVPEEPGISFASMIDERTLYDTLLDKYRDNRDAVEILKWAKLIEGCFTSYSAHAAGIVISDGNPVSDYLPLQMNEELGMMVTQCDKEQVEDNGLLKFDFLGLKTLDVITQSIRIVERERGLIIDPLKIDLADKKVYKEIFAAGRTNAVFQFESSGMKSMLKRFKPESFEDLIILVSMFRPGPMQYLDDVIAVKNGTKPATYLCPQLEPILGKTYGAIVYQEQVMEVCQKLAGFTLGHADEVRRYMSKKKADKLAHEEQSFLEGCEKNGISNAIAKELFSQMMDFASYAFNKSHAAAYAYNAFVTGWLKYYYPDAFFTAALNWTTPKKLPGLMYEAKEFGVDIKAPDINLSGLVFEDRSKTVWFGLGSVAGVKNNAVDILRERKNGEFTSLSDFLVRVNPNSKVVENLISAGAFDAFSKNRSAMKEMSKRIKEIIPKILKKRSFIASAKEVLPVVESLDAQALAEYQKNRGLKVEIEEPTTTDALIKRIATAENALATLEKELSLVRESKIEEDQALRMEEEKELLGMYVTSHPIDLYPSCKELDATPINDISGVGTIYGIIENLQIKARKKDGKKMAFFTLEDKSGSISVSVFTEAYEKYAALIRDGNVVTVYGNCQEEEFGGEIELKFTAKRLGRVEVKKNAYLLHVKSYASFYLDAEEAFKASYEAPNGHRLFIYDEAMAEMREARFKVSSDVEMLGAEKIYI